MIVKEIPREYEAIQYNGQNSELITKFCSRHGVQIEWRTNDDMITIGTIHTMEGSMQIVRQHWLLADERDQIKRVFPKEIGDGPEARYVVVNEEQDRLQAPDPVIEPEPPIEELEEEITPAQVGNHVDFSDLPSLSEKPSVDERMDKLENKFDEVLNLLRQGVAK